MLPWSRVGGPDVLVVSSLAKAFGVPMALLSGSRAAVEDFESKSETRMHCSPPSEATVHAAEHALAVNRTHSDALRWRLAGLVARFRRRAAQAGLRFTGGLFPVQTMAPSPLIDAVNLYERLLQRGVRAVLHHAREGAGARLSFLLTARHLPREIDLAVGALAEALHQGQSRIAAGGERQ
jgi:8-amino-7-oxononanoate synthase